MTDIFLIFNFIFFLVKRAGRHFGFFKRAGRHEKGAGRRALQKKPRQNTVRSNHDKGSHKAWQAVCTRRWRRCVENNKPARSALALHIRHCRFHVYSVKLTASAAMHEKQRRIHIPSQYTVQASHFRIIFHLRFDMCHTTNDTNIETGSWVVSSETKSARHLDIVWQVSVRWRLWSQCLHRQSTFLNSWLWGQIM